MKDPIFDHIPVQWAVTEEDDQITVKVSNFPGRFVYWKDSPPRVAFYSPTQELFVIERGLPKERVPFVIHRYMDMHTHQWTSPTGTHIFEKKPGREVYAQTVTYPRQETRTRYVVREGGFSFSVVPSDRVARYGLQLHQKGKLRSIIPSRSGNYRAEEIDEVISDYVKKEGWNPDLPKEWDLLKLPNRTEIRVFGYVFIVRNTGKESGIWVEGKKISPTYAAPVTIINRFLDTRMVGRWTNFADLPAKWEVRRRTYMGDDRYAIKVGGRIYSVFKSRANNDYRVELVKDGDNDDHRLIGHRISQTSAFAAINAFEIGTLSASNQETPEIVSRESTESAPKEEQVNKVHAQEGKEDRMFSLIKFATGSHLAAKSRTFAAIRFVAAIFAVYSMGHFAGNTGFGPSPGQIVGFVGDTAGYPFQIEVWEGDIHQALIGPENTVVDEASQITNPDGTVSYLDPVTGSRDVRLGLVKHHRGLFGNVVRTEITADAKWGDQIVEPTKPIVDRQPVDQEQVQNVKDELADKVLNRLVEGLVEQTANTSF